MKILIYLLQLSAFILFLPLWAMCQKLPNDQKNGIYIGSAVKIDGDATEINYQFQAYNSGQKIYYTLLNDEKNFYLLLRTSDVLTIRKIIAGGITFKAYNVKDSKRDEGVSVTYPIFDKRNPPGINLKNMPDPVPDPVRNNYLMDSVRRSISEKFSRTAKQIIVAGIDKKADTLSIYNDMNIKAAVKFNTGPIYTYELALPLEYIKNAIGDTAKFKYIIILNGSNSFEGAVIENIQGGVRVTGGSFSAKDPDVLYMRFPTDFSGEYVIAKKSK